MASRPPSGAGLYLYAIADAHLPLPTGLAGIEGARLQIVAHGPVGAVASPTALTRIRPQRAHLSAHRDVLRGLLEAGTVLPVKFGHIATGRAEVERLLEAHRFTIAAQLARVGDKVEMGLKVRWDVPNVFEFLLSLHPELAALRERLLPADRDATRDEKIALGRAFDQRLGDERDQHAARLESALEPAVAELKRLLPPRDLHEVVQFAALVPRKRVTAFEEAVHRAAARYDDHFAFDLSGPWPPHNFVDLDLAAEPA